MKRASKAKKRVAVTFENATLAYIRSVARTRGESFSAVCGSMLREIMRDDLACEER